MASTIPPPSLAPIDSATYSRLSALQKACSSPEALERLLDAGADPNQPFDFNDRPRPLHCAIAQFKPDSVALLLRRGADPRLDDALAKAISYAHNGGAALACAAAIASCPLLSPTPSDPLLSSTGGCPSLIPLLVARGFNPNALKAAHTCLGHSLSLGLAFSGDFVRAMVRAGADPNLDAGGLSPLASALLGLCSLEGIEALLDAGANPRWRLPATASSPSLDCLGLARQRRALPGDERVVLAIGARHRAAVESEQLRSALAPANSRGSKTL